MNSIPNKVPAVLAVGLWSTAILSVPACGDAKVPIVTSAPLCQSLQGVVPDLDATPLAPPGGPWFPAPAPETCADVPAAYVKQLVVSPTGRIALGGTFSGPADFGAGPLSGSPGSTAYRLVFVTAFSASGQARWSHALSGTDVAVAIDGQDNVTVAHATIAALNELGGSATVDQFDATGNLRWSQEVAFAPDKEHRGFTLAADADGSLVVAVPGRLVKLGGDGTFQWQHAFDYVYPKSIAFNSRGQLVMSGISEVLYGPEYEPAFVALLNASGGPIWRLAIESPGGAGSLDRIRSTVGTDPDDIGVTGFFADQVSLGGNVIVTAAPDSSFGNFLLRLDGEGRLRSATQNPLNVGYIESLAFGTDHTLVGATPSGDGITVWAFGCDGQPSAARSWGSLPGAAVLAAPVSNSADVVIAGSTGTTLCGDCAECYAPHPFLFRVTRQGAPALGFEAHH